MNPRTFAILVLAGLPWLAVAETPSRSSGAPGSSPERPAREAETRAKRLAASVVITNDVLQDLYGAGAVWLPPEPDEPDEPGEVAEAAEAVTRDERTALQRLQDDQARRRTIRDLASRERRRVTELEGRLRELEQRLLAVRNPYLPRPQVPEEEKEAWDGLDGAQRVERTQKQIDGVRDELEESRERLARLEAGQAPQ